MSDAEKPTRVERADMLEFQLADERRVTAQLRFERIRDHLWAKYDLAPNDVVTADGAIRRAEVPSSNGQAEDAVPPS